MSPSIVPKYPVLSTLYFCAIESRMWIPQKREHDSSLFTILSSLYVLSLNWITSLPDD